MVKFSTNSGKNDADLIERLRDLDEDFADNNKSMTPWEVNFLNTVLSQEQLSPKQRKSAKGILEKYCP